MANLGANGRLVPWWIAPTSETGWIARAGGVVLSGVFVTMPAFGASRDDTVGSTAAPSLKMTRLGVFTFELFVKAGDRTVKAKVRQTMPASPQPQLRVRANPGLGIAADVVATAPAGTDWVTVGPAEFTASADGIVTVELWCLAPGTAVECWWDDVLTT